MKRFYTISFSGFFFLGYQERADINFMLPNLLLYFSVFNRFFLLIKMLMNQVEYSISAGENALISKNVRKCWCI